MPAKPNSTRHYVAACLATLALTFAQGCATSEYAAFCFAPSGRLAMQQDDAILSEINFRLPFHIEARDFSVKQSLHGRIVWLAVLGDDRSAKIRSVLTSSPDFSLLSEGFFSAEDRDRFLFGP